MTEQLQLSYKRFRQLFLSLLVLPGLFACSDSGIETDAPAPAGNQRETEDWEAAAASASDAMVERGQRLFQMCASCHGIDEGELSPAGPSLYGIAGRRVGGLDSYPYTQALANQSETWTVGKFDAFIASPQEAYPGTGMAYSGLKSSEDRVALVAYMATKSMKE